MTFKSKCDLKVGRTIHRGLSYGQVLEMLSRGQAPFYAQLSQPESEQWFDMLKFADFPDFLMGKLMLAATGLSHESLFNHWYIKDGERSFGPFSLLQMLEFHRQKRLHLDNLIRHASHEKWEAFSVCEPFTEKNLQQLLSCPQISTVASRRKMPRISYANEVFVSCKAELYRGVSWSLSSQGLGLVTDESTNLELGSRVNIIVNANNEHGAVQVKGKVVNIKKESNYERVAVEFDDENEFLNLFIQQRIPKL